MVGHDDIIGPVERDTVVRKGRPMVLVRVRLPEADEFKYTITWRNQKRLTN
nr:MAG TPA: hypothetical protein [Bacteriophage sp.]